MTMHPHPVPTGESEGLRALQEALLRAFSLMRWVMLLLLLGYLASGLFIVRQHEKAVVLHFGRFDGLGDERIRQPGFHWTWPRPFSEIIRIPAGRVGSLTSTTFWSDTTPDMVGETLAPLVHGYALSGDANIFHAQWAIRYTVEQPDLFLFGAENPDTLIERELDRAVLHAAARTSIDHLLRTDLETFRAMVDRDVRARLAALPLCITIQGVDLLHVAPPAQVAEAFDAVIRAEQEQAEEITDARAYAARRLNEAAGEAEEFIAGGETKRAQLIAAIAADARYFEELRPSFTAQPALMRELIWQDALRRAVGSAGQVFVVPSDAEGRRDIRLQLSPRRENPFAEVMP